MAHLGNRANIFSQAVINVAETLAGLGEEAAKSKAVPFMEEKISLQSARARWKHMGPEERRVFIQKHGVPAAIKLVKDPSGTGSSGGGFVLPPSGATEGFVEELR